MSNTVTAPGFARGNELIGLLQRRIAIIDGAMGTTIRTYGKTEADIRGQRFANCEEPLLNNGDLFSLTQPDMICDIHRRFLEAGADIIETNTFGATSISQSEFFVEDPRRKGGRKDPAFYQKIIEDQFLNDLAWEINEVSARQCREWADRVANKDGKQRFVAGAIGPLTVSLSNSPDADDSGFRVVTFDQVKQAYINQVRALIKGGSDFLLVETIFDSLNAKAALVAIQEVFEQDKIRLPISISAAVGRGGETMISAQTIEAYWNAVKHVKPLSIGLNCSLGPDLMRPFLAELKRKVEEAGLADRILFPDEVPPSATPDWYAALDLFVAPQRWEGFGVTPLEAMAAGVPVVATSVGAFPELVVDGVTGSVIPPGNVEAMVREASGWLDDSGRLERGGEAARAHVSAQFSLAGEAEAINAVYRRLWPA
jgi:methionine synthase I (cobalamin-dependent)